MSFKNLDGSSTNKGFGDVLRWKLGLGQPSEARPELAEQARGIVAAPWVENDGAQLRHGSRSNLTWIGHATFLAQLGGASILIDPVLSERIKIEPERLSLVEVGETRWL